MSASNKLRNIGFVATISHFAFQVSGTRHKCEQCADYDMCATCFAGNVDGALHDK